MFELSMTHAERGYRFYRKRKIGEAVEQFRLGAQAGEDPEPAALERWLSFMMAGDFESAWQESDRVLECRRKTGAICSDLPEHQRWLWDGTPLAGKRVMVRCFHGLGDTIQFIRFLPQLRALCSDVQILPQVELQDLIPSVTGKPADLEIELMEVPHALRSALSDIPCEVPYLHPATTQHKRSRFYRVGLAWASGSWRPERSVPLEYFQFFDCMPECELIGLQRGPEAFRRLFNGPVFHEANWENNSVLETARIICTLDLVITTDTMVAHLAGALGANVWTLLHWEADWRWMTNRKDSPWYPTMRLFRQKRPGNWAGVVERVRSELTNNLKKIRQNQTRACGEAESAHAP